MAGTPRYPNVFVPKVYREGNGGHETYLGGGSNRIKIEFNAGLAEWRQWVLCPLDVTIFITIFIIILVLVLRDALKDVAEAVLVWCIVPNGRRVVAGFPRCLKGEEM